MDTQEQGGVGVCVCVGGGVHRGQRGWCRCGW